MLNQYYNQITEVIEKYEVKKRVRERQNNREELLSKWTIGKLIVEAQGGSDRAKYGNELIKKWSEDFTLKYGKGYDSTNLKRFRQFYLTFQKGGTLCNVNNLRSNNSFFKLE